MGLIEYVPALITFDYLIVAINNLYAAQVARYIHSHCKKTCGILTTYNTEYEILLQSARNQHKRIIYLYTGICSLDLLFTLFKTNQKEIHIPVSTDKDGPVIVSIIGNHTF